MVAAERSSSAMADAATAFLGQPDARAAPEGGVSLRVRRADALELHPDRDLSAQGPDRQGDDRGAARRRARPAEGRPEPARLHDGHRDHGARERPRRDRAARPRGGRQAEGLRRDPVRYFFSVFGTPSPRSTWGWRVEGHHVSLHFTVVNGTLVACSPTFFGSNPAEVPRRSAARGMRILAAEEDAARALLMALDAAQRAKAVINATAPNEIVTTNKLESRRCRRPASRRPR